MVTRKDSEECPCKGCVARTEDCHSKCLKYYSWTLVRKAVREENASKHKLAVDMHSVLGKEPRDRRFGNYRKNKRRN